MLSCLKIENYALIRELDISPSSGLNIITGETGAGKSIMLGAVGLLLGKRADTKVLSNQGKKCIIEGVFNIEAYALAPFFKEKSLDYEAHSTVRREITPTGKSRAFINDTPVTLEVMKQFGMHLMDIHSQHDTLILKDNFFQLSLIDYFAGNSELLTDYQNQYKTYKQQKLEIQNLQEQITTLQKEGDYDQFLLEELIEAKLESEEQEILEQELSVLDNAEEIKSKLHLAGSLLSRGEQSIENSIQEVKHTLQHVQTFSPKYQELYARIDSTHIELKDIANEIGTATEQVLCDSERLNFVKERLGLIYQLQQKHKVNTVSLLLEIQEELAGKAVKTTVLEENLLALTTSANALRVEVVKIGGQLSSRREQVFDQMKEELESLLVGLGMPDAVIDIKKESTELTLTGMDKITLLFSANKGVLPAAIGEVASGGELSRLMFCVKYILANKTALPTIIFDEIDTGISGEVAMKMGRMMLSIANKHQVITITHLPQIAAMAQYHYFVYKDQNAEKAVSRIKLLNEKEHIGEIATMIGGDDPSDAAYYSAKELIK